MTKNIAKENITNRKCPVCECEKYTISSEQHIELPEFYGLDEVFYIVTCNRCGFVFSVSKSTRKDYDNYYESCNFYMEKHKVNVVSTSVSKLHLSILEQIPFNVNGKLLDMGCGGGGLVQALTSLGAKDVYACDPSPFTIDSLQKSGIKGFKASIYDKPEAKYANQFDTVFVMGVFEHLFSPSEALNNVMEYLKDDGELIIQLPDSSWDFSESDDFEYYVNQEHINFFTKTSLANLIKNQNVAINEIKTPYLSVFTKTTAFFVRYLLARVSKKEVSNPDNKELIFDKGIIEVLEKRNCVNEKFKNLRNSLIYKYAEEKTPVIIWGCGALTMFMLKNTLLLDCNIIKLIDGSILKQGTKLASYIIEEPQKDLPKDAVVFIISSCHNTDILNEVRLLGNKNEVVCFN